MSVLKKITITFKITFLLAFAFFSASAYSQDTKQMRHIDSLVGVINTSNFKVQRDTIHQERPELGLSMRTYLTMVSNGSELKKYVNNVRGFKEENGMRKEMVTTNAFYFDQGKLIKVEEYYTEGDKKFEAFWYYSNDKAIYYTLQTEKAESRAELLLTMARSMLEKFKQ